MQHTCALAYLTAAVCPQLHAQAPCLAWLHSGMRLNSTGQRESRLLHLAWPHCGLHLNSTEQCVGLRLLHLVWLQFGVHLNNIERKPEPGAQQDDELQADVGGLASRWRALAAARRNQASAFAGEGARPAQLQSSACMAHTSLKRCVHCTNEGGTGLVRPAPPRALVSFGMEGLRPKWLPAVACDGRDGCTWQAAA